MIGAGSWGIALSVLLHNNGHDITVWSALKEEIEMLTREHEHKEKLPGVKLAEEIVFTTVLAEAVRDKDILVLAVPSSFTRATAHNMKDLVAEGQIVVNVAKGIEESSLMTLSQVIEDEIPQADVAVLSGPSHAEEVGKCIPLIASFYQCTCAICLHCICQLSGLFLYLSLSCRIVIYPLCCVQNCFKFTPGYRCIKQFI